MVRGATHPRGAHAEFPLSADRSELLNDKTKQVDKENRVKRLAQQAEDGKKARADYEAEGRAVREKMAKLKALRLAKEAADQDAADKAPKPVKAAAKKKAGKEKAGKEKAPPLSDWLKSRDGDGHRS
jgi:hypothetical protein